MSIKPKDKVFFCSAASRYAKELLPGTASNYNCFILIEYSRPFPAKISQTEIDKEWLHSLNALVKERKGKVVLIRNKDTSEKCMRIVFTDMQKKRYAEFVTDTENYTQINLAERIMDANTIWLTDPFFIVCTNGKKDKCCAKFGFPVFRFLEDVSEVGKVWECTHIGGDRFAANIVYLPFGIYYGRILMEDLPPILDACDENKIHVKNYRGLCTRSFLVQTVEYYLRMHTNDLNIEFPLKILHKEQIENEFVLDAATTHGRFRISVQKQVILYPHLLTCTSKKRENVVKYLLNYIHNLAE